MKPAEPNTVPASPSRLLRWLEPLTAGVLLVVLAIPVPPVLLAPLALHVILVVLAGLVVLLLMVVLVVPVVREVLAVLECLDHDLATPWLAPPTYQYRLPLAWLVAQVAAVCGASPPTLASPCIRLHRVGLSKGFP